ncbi:sugar porter family MFS transporter [Aspergillus brunneoviolaceus CBS 621.78]|uniref:General substrate transporter n=1 Tax=Aspergillus brunneoviolaceus CBS 621.78 TaxID=1450534 RepID=A0ACD1GMP3_9EURO|nr:general substrate transporter [Aspergillus brunneoviolaceus CBS 621.78]RAH50374.1 general substrate transporter [Aspergillus brunneoviolaceus CBS 621.78]
MTHVLDMLGIRGEWRAIAISLFITIAAFQFGFDSSYYSGILDMDPFIKAYGHYDSATGGYVLSSSIQSLTTSIINVGELVGAVSSYLVDDRIGRRGGLFVSSAFVTAGVIFQVAADNLALLIVGRLLMGYAVGLISCLVPLYVADCAPTRFRGALVSVYQFDVGLGLLFGVIVDYATKDRTDSGSYRIPMAVQLVFPIILVPGLILFCPESPRWLLSKGRTEQARAALRRLYGDRPDFIESEIVYITSMVEEEQRNDSSWGDLFKWKVDGRKTYLGCSIQAFQQASGINFITSYGIVFFSQIGITNSFLIQMGLYLTPMPAVWLNQYCVERFGRRVMLLVSCSLVCVVLFVVGGAGTATDKTMSLDQVIVAMVYIFMVVFNLALGPAVWVVTSEISTGPNRSKLMATSTGTNWFFSWVVTFTFPYLFNADGANLSARVGFIYGGLMFGAALWIYFFLPETAGRSLEDIQVMFENGVPARKFKSYEIPQTTRLAVLEDEKEVRATEMESV